MPIGARASVDREEHGALLHGAQKQRSVGDLVSNLRAEPGDRERREKHGQRHRSGAFEPALREDAATRNRAREEDLERAAVHFSGDGSTGKQHRRRSSECVAPFEEVLTRHVGEHAAGFERVDHVAQHRDRRHRTERVRVLLELGEVQHRGHEHQLEHHEEADSAPERRLQRASHQQASSTP
jgi:hypothetical protein